MSANRSKLALSASSQRIRQARKALKTMSPQLRIDLMVQAGVMTPQQADKAKSKLAAAAA